jgi:toxin ParE1/3/4
MPARTILRHRKSKRDALNAFVYIGERNMDAARRFLRAMNTDLHQLADMPGMGPAFESNHPELAGIHFLPITGFRNYLLFYRFSETAIELCRIIHGARDIEAELLR